MTTEEKAKAYDEAIERAKAIHNREYVPTPSGIGACEYIFPELRESEDERIRKGLLDIFKQSQSGHWAGMEIKDIVAWLEKQKEQKCLPGFDDMTPEEKMNHPLYLEGFDVGRDVGHIEAEQKRVILDNPLTGEACYEVEIREYMKGADPDEMAAVLLLTKKGWTVIAPGHEQKPAEWSEDWREEDIQTRFAFYTYKDEDGVLYLSNVFVEEASRNHGFGTKILIAAEKVAETIGATTISLKVKQDSPANAWYRKNGYGYVAFEDGYDWLEKNLEYMKPKRNEQPASEGLEKAENEEFEKELHQYWLEEKQKGVIVDGSLDDYITVQEVASHFTKWGAEHLKR